MTNVAGSDTQIPIKTQSSPKHSHAQITTKPKGDKGAPRLYSDTTYDGDEDIHRALQAGAQAYLLKDMVRKELVQTIREVHAGNRYIPAPVAARLAEHTPRVALLVSDSHLSMNVRMLAR